MKIKLLKMKMNASEDKQIAKIAEEFNEIITAESRANKIEEVIDTIQACYTYLKNYCTDDEIAVVAGNWFLKMRGREQRGKILSEGYIDLEV